MNVRLQGQSQLEFGAGKAGPQATGRTADVGDAGREFINMQPRRRSDERLDNLAQVDRMVIPQQDFPVKQKLPPQSGTGVKFPCCYSCRPGAPPRPMFLW